MYRIAKSQHCTPKANITLHMNYSGIKFKKKKSLAHNELCGQLVRTCSGR